MNASSVWGISSLGPRFSVGICSAGDCSQCHACNNAAADMRVHQRLPLARCRLRWFRAGRAHASFSWIIVSQRNPMRCFSSAHPSPSALILSGTDAHSHQRRQPDGASPRALSRVRRWQQPARWVLSCAAACPLVSCVTVGFASCIWRIDCHGPAASCKMLSRLLIPVTCGLIASWTFMPLRYVLVLLCDADNKAAATLATCPKTTCICCPDPCGPDLASAASGWRSRPITYVQTSES